MIAEHKFSDVERRNTNISKILSLANNGAKVARYSEGSFENEALENEDRSTKHPNLEKEAPKSRKRGTQNSKTKTPKLRTIMPVPTGRGVS